MDDSDPNIVFNLNGKCDYCINFNNNIQPFWKSLLNDSNYLNNLSRKIRNDNHENKYDCIIGISGGLDSSYAAYVAVKFMSLKPLLYHVDTGWNTHQAVTNISKITDGLKLELITDVINWDEMKELQRSFFLSGIPDQDLPQDSVIFSSLYKYAYKNNFKHVITGSNFSSECCREPEEWGGYLGIDKKLINDIHYKFSNKSIDSLPILDIFHYKIFYQFLSRMIIHKPLNSIPFNQKAAESELNFKFGWEPFQHKHHESRFTRFFEDFWLPRRFGFDKRRAHFSSLIMSGQISRSEALSRISNSEMSESFLWNEFEYVASKLDFSLEAFEELLNAPKKTYKDYKNKRFLIGLGTSLMRNFQIEKRLFR